MAAGIAKNPNATSRTMPVETSAGLLSLKVR
jgi:hypothetical protein